jgi:hypothetical protein
MKRKGCNECSLRIWSEAVAYFVLLCLKYYKWVINITRSHRPQKYEFVRYFNPLHSVHIIWSCLSAWIFHFAEPLGRIWMEFGIGGRGQNGRSSCLFVSVNRRLCFPRSRCRISCNFTKTGPSHNKFVAYISVLGRDPRPLRTAWNFFFPWELPKTEPVTEALN